MLEFDIWTIAFSIINILVLFLFLKKFLFGRIQNIMDQRATAVQADLDQAKASKEEAHQLRQQYEDTLSGAKQEASTIIANARTAAKEQGNQITEQAQQEASRMIQNAQKEIDAERQILQSTQSKFCTASGNTFRTTASFSGMEMVGFVRASLSAGHHSQIACACSTTSIGYCSSNIACA